MKIKELISILETFDQEKEVFCFDTFTSIISDIDYVSDNNGSAQINISSK